jgi:hypothetical protein
MLKILMRKALKDDKLAYFKKLILDHLDQLGNDDKEQILKKAGMPVGTIRDWKGKKYIKTASGKWKPKYDNESRGAKIAVSAIKRKIASAKDAHEMMRIVLENRDRFSDAEGHPLPFIMELSEYVASVQDGGANAAKRSPSLYQAGDYMVKRRGKNEFIVTDKEGNIQTHFNHTGQSDSFDELKYAKRYVDILANPTDIPRTDPEKLKAMQEEEREGYNNAIASLYKNGTITKKQAMSKLTNKNRLYRKTLTEARKLLRVEKQKDIPKEVQSNLEETAKKFYPKTDETETGIDNAAAFKAVQEKYHSAESVEGEKDEIAVGKEIVSGKWRLVEADTPTASHDERTFNKTKGFPTTGDGSTINDRDYEKDRAAQEIVIDIGMDYDMRALSFDSPIVVTKDGIVISGNNRTMSSKIAARQGTDTKYIEALKKKAKKFGFTPADVSKFKNPRVIFETDENEGYSTALFAKFNSDDKKAMNPIEEAVKVSKIIKQETVEAISIKISDFETLGELYADKRAPREIFDTLVAAGVVGKNQLPKYYTEQTGITGDGKNFIETSLLGSILTESNIRGLNREGCKSIRQKLVRAITPLVENKGMDGYSIIKELNSGVDIVMQATLLKDKFHNVSEFAEQGTMFEKLDPLAIEFAKKLEGTQKSFAEFMQSMNGGLKYSANGEVDVFLGEVESREDILARMLNTRKSIEKAVDGALRFFAGLRNGRGSFERKKVVLNRAGERVEDYRWVMRKSESAALEKQAIVPHAELMQEAHGGEKTIAIDFDGVINSYTSGWRGATETDDPVVSAATAIDGLFNRGYKLIIFSTRANTLEGVETIREYIRRHTENDPLADSIEITDRKPIADVYIDDRAIPFTGNWAETLEQIETFKPWIEKSLTWSGYPLQDRMKVQGMDISIENKKGSTRSGVDKDGHEWHTKMGYDYGYIRGTVGVDKDHLDAYVGPNPKSEIVYIVNQNDPVTGKFDEQKVMLGFNNEGEAKAAYLKQYDRPGFFGDILKMDIDTFKEEAFDPQNKGKPLKR